MKTVCGSSDFPFYARLLHVTTENVDSFKAPNQVIILPAILLWTNPKSLDVSLNMYTPLHNNVDLGSTCPDDNANQLIK